MELRHLKIFLVVAQELNLTRAAAKLHITQPPLSREIKKIEKNLGTQLFMRGTHGLTLTATGNVLQEQARHILARVESLEETINRMERGQKPHMGIGFVPSVFYDQLPLLVKEIRQKDNIDLALAELTTIQQVEALKTGEIDLGFGRLRIDDPDLEQVVLFDEPMLAAVPRDHPLTRTSPSLEQLADYPLILFPSKPRPSLADQTLGLFRRRCIKVQVIQETNELQTALSLVASNLGIALVPAQVRHVQRRGTSFISLDDSSITSPIICSRRRGEVLPPDLEKMLDAIRYQS